MFKTAFPFWFAPAFAGIPGFGMPGGTISGATKSDAAKASAAKVFQSAAAQAGDYMNTQAARLLGIAARATEATIEQTSQATTAALKVAKDNVKQTQKTFARFSGLQAAGAHADPQEWVGAAHETCKEVFERCLDVQREAADASQKAWQSLAQAGHEMAGSVAA